MGPDLRARLLIGCLAALLLAGAGVGASSAATATGGEVTGIVDDVLSVRAWSPWPDGLRKGYQPVLVELLNEGQDSRRITIMLRNFGGERIEVERSLSLDAGQGTTLELMAPCYADHSNEYGLQVQSGGRREFLGQVGASDYPYEELRAVVVFSGTQPEAGLPERWSEEVSTAALEVQHWTASVHLGGGSRTPPETPRNDNIQMVAALFDDLPRRPEAYTSLDVVAIDGTRGLPAPESLEGLLQWLRTGGTLVLFAPEAERLARRDPRLEPWMEPRFEFPMALVDGELVRSWRCGFGTLITASADGPEEFLAGAPREALRWAVGTPRGAVPDGRGFLLDHVRNKIPGLGDLPHRSFAVLLILFALVIGPVNFAFVKKSGKPVLLLITIPLIALTTSGLLMAYGIFYQGLDVKTASTTYTVLDQRVHRAATLERRLLFAGLSPTSGLRPGAGTSCHVLPFHRGHRRRNPDLRIDATRDLVLAGDFLPVRQQVDQVLIGERAARVRLEVEPGPPDTGGLTVTNAFEVTLDDLILRDDSGDYHQLVSPLQPAASALLRPLATDDAEREARSIWNIDQAQLKDLVPGSYTARLAAGAFQDDCGIEVNELAGRHAVLGILAPRAAPQGAPRRQAR